jgi:hypothetical protein
MEITPLFCFDLWRNHAAPSHVHQFARIRPGFYTKNAPLQALFCQTQNANSLVAGKLFTDRKKCQGMTSVVP